MTTLTGTFLLWVAFMAMSCGSESAPFDGSGEDLTGDTPQETVTPCTGEGTTQCFGLVFQTCTSGQWENTQDCGATDQRCDAALGCVDCTPLHPYCEGNLLMQCTAEGTEGPLIADCAALSGTICSTATGSCISLCDQAAAERSNVGCLYWAVDLDNAANSMDDAASAQFAVVVANVNISATATVTVTTSESGYGNPPAPNVIETARVSPSSLYVFNLPQRDVDGPDSTPHMDDGPQSCLSSLAFRIESDIPIVAYQFNPITQDFSNDASLLIPQSGLDTLHYVIMLPPTNPITIAGLIEHPNRCYVTVVGTQENTLVSVTPSYDIEASLPPIPAGYYPTPPILAGETYQVTLGPYEVLNLENKELARLQDPFPDLTGTVVDADKPIAVFSGVDLASVGGDLVPGCEELSDCSCCAEHVEQQVIPKTSMGRKYVVVRSPMRNSGGWIEPDVYRVMAARDDTQITTNLPDAELASFTLGALEWKEFKSKTGFVLEASKPVHVAQFLVSGMQTEAVIGDASMLPFPAAEERRPFYVFTTGVGFEKNYAVISMPEGYDATIDGADVASTCGAPVTSGVLEGLTYLAYTCEIPDGAHTVDGGLQPVGVFVYGYYYAGSYAYPAGSDLRKIFLE